jgi:hypothetical protein
MAARFAVPDDEGMFAFDLDEDRGAQGFVANPFARLSGEIEEIKVYDANGLLFGVIDPGFAALRRSWKAGS